MASRESSHNVLCSIAHLSNKDSLQPLHNSGYSLSGAYKVIKIFDTDEAVKDSRRYNGAHPKISGTSAEGLVHDKNNATNKSLRKTAKNFNVYHKTISNTLKRYEMTYHKWKTAPLYNPAKKNDIKKALERLYREHLVKGDNGNPFIIMDDETYVTQNDEAKFSGKTFYA